MATLTAKQRKRVPRSKQGLPKKKGPQGGAPKGNYPMPDKSHARNAKARAAQQVKKGNLSKSSQAKIDAKANRILGKSRKR